MMGITHRAGSIVFSSVALAVIPVTVFSPVAAGILVVASAFGGLLPDADTPYSTTGRKYFLLLLPVYLLKWLFSLFGNLFKPLKKISKAMGHRGLFHGPIIWTFICGTLYLFFRHSNNFVLSGIIGLYIGAMSHVILDFFSGGVPLLAPFTMKRFKAPFHIKTDGLLEAFIYVAFFLLGGLLLIYDFRRYTRL